MSENLHTEEKIVEQSGWPAFIRVHSRGILLLLCAAVIVVLWLLQLTPYLNYADDSGRYMILGESLARNGELRLINDMRQPFDTLYPPLFSALIASWIRVTGQDAMRVVLLVKLTQLLLLLATLPMLLTALTWAKLSLRYIVACLLLYAFCPALIGYANEVMSEMPMLILCFASVLCAERSAMITEKENIGDENIANEEKEIEVRKIYVFRLLALFLAAGAFLVRSSGITLLAMLVMWFWGKFGWKWGLVAILVSLIVVGGWIRRNSHIVKTHPEIHYSSYADQFTLRDPMTPGAGRIPLNAHGLASRLKSGIPTYIGLIPRTMLHLMAPQGSPWFIVFYVLAISSTLLMLIGFVEAWRRGLTLWSGFAALFWYMTALWPWHSARFLVPILPFMFIFMTVGAAWAANALKSSLQSSLGKTVVDAAQIMCLILLITYFGYVNSRVIHQERKPTEPGYAFGRSKEEAGFYLACDWLRHHSDPKSVVMGKPQYLLHLYAGNFTSQLEPTDNAGNLEKAHMLPEHVRYLLEDSWRWGIVPSHEIVDAYLRVYGAEWELAWSDPNGSGTRVWKRKER